jgi:hypothetical protein
MYIQTITLAANRTFAAELPMPFKSAMMRLFCPGDGACRRTDIVAGGRRRCNRGST